VSFGRVSAKESADTDFTLGGNKTAPLLGIGAEYRVNRNMALTFDLDGYGKVSDKVKAGTATIGARYSS
jgi:opacity protein-like surface antigen